MTFGETLRKNRERLNLSQEATAKAIEAKYRVRLSAAYLSMIENEVKTNLTVKLINALLDFFELPLNAATSLFIQATPSPQEQSVCFIYETPDIYRSEEIALPAEAQQALKEFREFLKYKYNTGKKSLFS